MSCEVIVLPTNKPRYTITVNDAMLGKIDDFRFENRYASRSAATLELIRMGIESVKKKQEESEKDRASYNT
jgi:metal-responsive CopG/Arc/MetJ family transcriptional regulator